MRTASLRACLALALAAAGGIAHAHPGHGADGIAAGLLHPLLGMDHLLAMLAVGMWSAQLDGKSRRLVIASFLAVMGIAAAAAVAGIALPVLELGVAGSVVMAGLLLALRVRMAPAAGVAIVSLFALFHGYAHGAELPAHASVWTWFAGFLASSALLLFLGRGLGALTARRKAASAAAGSAVAAAGAWMLGALA